MKRDPAWSRFLQSQGALVALVAAVVLGALRYEHFIGAQNVSRTYCDEIVWLCLQSLGLDARRIEQALRHPLPAPVVKLTQVFESRS